MAENDVYAKRRAVATAKQSSGQLTPSSTAGKTVTNPNETSYSTSSTAYKASNGNVKTTASSAKKSSTGTTKAGNTTIVNIKGLGAGGNSAVSAGAKGTYDNTPKKKEPTQAEAAAAQAEYNRLMNIDLKRQQAAIEQQQKLAANSRVGMVNAGGTFLGGSETTNVRGNTAAELKLAQMQLDYNRAEETQRYTKYEKQLSALSDKDREIIQTLANYSQNPNSTKNSDGVPITQSQAINLGRIVEKSGYTQDEVKELVDAQVRVNNKADYLSKQEKFAATARGEDTILGITGKGIASAASTFENLAAGTGYLSVLRQNIANIGAEDKSPIDYYTPGMAHAAAANAARSEVSKIIIENAQAKNPDKENAGQILSYLYQTGMSMVDSGVIAASALIGIPPIVGTTLLGGAAASSTLMEAHERGLSDTQAILTATAAGVAETLFEKVGIESLLKNTLEAPIKGTVKQQLQQALKHTALQGLVEGSEEGFTSIANLITDSIINGKMSDFNQSVYAYMASGMDPDAAKRAAIKDTAKSIGLDVLGGLISGGVMAGAPNFARVASYAPTMNALAEQTFTQEGLLNAALQNNVQSDAVAKISKAVDAGKKVSNAVLREAAVDISAEVLKNNESEVVSYIAEQLRQSGETTAEATELVEALKKGYILAAAFEEDGFTYEAASRLYGPSLSKAEVALVNKSDFGNDLLSDMLDLPINLGIAEQMEALSEESRESAAVSGEIVNTEGVQNATLSSAVQEAQKNGGVSNQMVSRILKDKAALEELGVIRSGQSDVKIRKEIREKLTDLAADLLDKSEKAANNNDSVVVPDTDDYKRFAAKMRETHGDGILERDILAAYEEATTFTVDGETFTNQEFIDAYKKAHPEASEREVKEALMQAKELADGETAKEDATNENRRTDGNNRGVGRKSDERTGKYAGGSRKRASGNKTAVRSRRVDSVRGNARGQSVDGRSDGSASRKTEGLRAGPGSGGYVLNSKAARHAERVRALSLPTEQATYAGGITVNRVTDFSSLPEKEQANIERMVTKARAFGADVWFVLGDTKPGRKNAEGKPLRTYGTTYYDGSGNNVIVVSLDCEKHMPSSLFAHELIHAIQFKSGKTAVGAIVSRISETDISDVEDALTTGSAYTKVYGRQFGGGLNEKNRLDYWEEILGDIYANINRLGWEADKFEELRKSVFTLISEESAKHEVADTKSAKGKAETRDFIGNVQGYGAMAVVTPAETTVGSEQEGAAYAYINALQNKSLGDRREFLAKTLDGATQVRLHPRTSGEYTASKSTQNLGKNEKAAKMKAAVVLDDMVLLGENGRHRSDGLDATLANKHGDLAANGWTYLDTKFAVARETDTGVVYDLFSGSINIANAKDGKQYLYDISDIMQLGTVPEDQVSVYQDQPKGKPQTAPNPDGSTKTAELQKAPGTGKTTVAQDKENVKSTVLTHREEQAKATKNSIEESNNVKVLALIEADPDFQWSDNPVLNGAIKNITPAAVANLQKLASDAAAEGGLDTAVLVLSNYDSRLEDMDFAASDAGAKAIDNALHDMQTNAVLDYISERLLLQNQDRLHVTKDFGDASDAYIVGEIEDIADDDEAYWDEWEKALDTFDITTTIDSLDTPPVISTQDIAAPEPDAWGAVYTKWPTGTEVYEFPSPGALLGYAQTLADYIGLDRNSLDTTAFEGYMSAPSLSNGELIPMFKMYPGNVASADITNYRDEDRVLKRPEPNHYGAKYDKAEDEWTFPDTVQMKEYVLALAKYNGYENADLQLDSDDPSIYHLVNTAAGEVYADILYFAGYYPGEVVVSAKDIKLDHASQNENVSAPAPKATDFGANVLDDDSYGFTKDRDLLNWAEALGKFLGMHGTAVFDESLNTVEILSDEGVSDVLFPYEQIGRSKFVEVASARRLLGSRFNSFSSSASDTEAPAQTQVVKAALGKLESDELSEQYGASKANYGQSVSFASEEGLENFIWDAIDAVGLYDEVTGFVQDTDKMAVVVQMLDGSEQVLFPMEKIYDEGGQIRVRDLEILLGDVRPAGYENAPWVNPRVKDNLGVVPGSDVFKVGDDLYYDRVTGREVFSTNFGFQYSLLEDSLHRPLSDKLAYLAERAEERLSGATAQAPKDKAKSGTKTPAGNVVLKDSEFVPQNWIHPTDTDTEAFYAWFNDPTPSHELTLPDGSPRLLFTGTSRAGFTAHDSKFARAANKGIWTTNDYRGATAYSSSGPEFMPAVLPDWDTAVDYTRSELKMQLRKEDNLYTLYYFTRDNLWRPTASYTADQNGLDLFNEQYGEIHSDYGVPNNGYYKVYGTSTRALIVDCYGRTWSNIGVAEGGGSTSTDEMVDLAFNSGYDCVIFKNLHDGAYARDGRPTLMNDYVFKESGQVKSIYNDGSWNRANKDMRHMAEEADGTRAEALDKLIRRAESAYQAAQHTEDKRPHSAKAAGSIAQQDDHLDAWVIYSSLGRQYGTIPQTGKNNARPVHVPTRVKPDTKVHKTTSTVMSAEATPNKRLRTIAEAVVDDKMSYTPDTNKIQINKANAHIKKVGFKRALLEWTSDVSKGKVNGDLVAMGATLLNNAGNSDASGEEYLDIMDTYTELLQNASQGLQAAKILKTLTPQGRLYMVGRKVDKINNELREHGFDPSKYPDVEIDPELIKAYNKAQNEDERSEIMKQITQNIADQIKATPMDKFTAWRYLAMLGNFRTQVRNVAGNTFMQPVRMMKETIAGLAEAMLERAGVDIDRTTSAVADMPTFRAAIKDFKNVQAIILAGGKYDDSRSLSKEINDKRRIFKSKILEGYRRGTNFLMDWGDAVFCSFTYADSLARFMAANHTTWEDATEELRDKGREIAIREAAEATYRDNNAFSNLILNLRIKNPTTGVGKVAAAAVEGVLPFRKTPANILVRTVEYSPLYILKTAHDAVQLAQGKGNVTGADIVNEAAKTLTGSGLLVLGAWLASFGKLIGKAPEDDKERELWDMQGHQAYALEIGGHSYTLDWAAPVCIPMFLGANLVQVFQENGLSLSTLVEALNTITDPVLEMSMLQGIQDLIDNAANFGDEGALVRLTANALTSYISQVVPTMLGQGKRAFLNDNKRMQTYTDKNSDVPGDWQYALGKMAGKIPFWNYAQTVYTDAWGRTEANANNQTLNVLQQFFSPGYGSRIRTSPMEKELLRLSKATGENSVLISKASKYFTVNGERKDLTADEYYSYNTTRGRTAYDLMTELVNSSTYKAMTDAERVKAVAAIYDYSNQVAKQTVAKDFKPDAWVGYAQKAPQELKMSTVDYIVTKPDIKSFVSDADSHPKYVAAVSIGFTAEEYTDLKANVDLDGNGSTSQAEAQTYLDSTNLPREQKAAAWYLINKGWKKNPYGNLTSENKAILDDLYGEGWQDKKK